MNDMTKQNIIAALYTFCQKKPGFDPANYGDAASYRADTRRATQQLSDARRLLREIELRDSITAQDLLDAARSGRLDVTTTGDSVRIDYTCGQYWPTEYRAGVARLAASALWNWQRDRAMPEGTLHHNSEIGETLHRYGPQGLRAGDWLRASFRRQFGRGMASRYFN